MSSRKNVIIDIVNSDCILKKVLYSYNVLTRCIRETPKRVLLRIVKALDEMQHNAAFHQGLHCLF